MKPKPVQKQPAQVDPNELPDDKRKSDLEKLLQAVAMKKGKHNIDREILKSAPKGNTSVSPDSIPNPFRDQPAKEAI